MDFLSAYKGTTNPDKEDDDEFGEFTSAAPFTMPTAINNVPTGSLNHLGSYIPSTEPPSFSKPLVVPNGEPRFSKENEEDEFGDFCGPVQIPSAPSPNFQSVSHVQKPNYELDLSVQEFSPQLPWSSPEEPTVMQNPIFTQNDDDFGDFAAADVVPVPIENQNTMNRNVSVTDVSLPESSPSAREEDVFGDYVATETLDVRKTVDNVESLVDEQKESFLFSFEEAPVPAVSSSETGGIPESSKGSDSLLDSYDEFGEFTQASLPSLHYEEVEVEAAVPVTTDIPTPSQDDEFGHFSSVAMTDAAVQSQTQDEFGDFTSVIDSCAIPVEPPRHSEDDDFGDFTAVTEVATAAIPVEAQSWSQDDEDFGDFADAETEAKDDFTGSETAPPETSVTEMTAESKLHQVLGVIFPLQRPTDDGKLPPSLLQCCGSSRGALWSFLRDLDSSPALSFQWRSSSTHHKLLDTLRIDPKPMVNLVMPKWASPPSMTSSISSPEAPITIPAPIVPLNLDLDYFAASESSSSSSTSKLTTKTTSKSVSSNPVASLEKELLGSPLKSSVSSPGFMEGLNMLSPVKSGAGPPRSLQSSSTGTAERLGDLLEEFSFSSTTSSASLTGNADVLDLLQ